MRRSTLQDAQEYSSLSKGIFRVHPAQVSVLDIVSTAIYAIAEASPLDMHYSIDKAVPQVFETDQYRVVQVLSIALSNACTNCLKGKAGRARKIVLTVHATTMPDGKPAVLFRIANESKGLRKDGRRPSLLFQPPAVVQALTQVREGRTKEGKGVDKANRKGVVMGGPWASSASTEAGSSSISVHAVVDEPRSSWCSFGQPSPAPGSPVHAPSTETSEHVAATESAPSTLTMRDMAGKGGFGLPIVKLVSDCLGGTVRVFDVLSASHVSGNAEIAGARSMASAMHAMSLDDVTAAPSKVLMDAATATAGSKAGSPSTAYVTVFELTLPLKFQLPVSSTSSYGALTPEVRARMLMLNGPSTGSGKEAGLDSMLQGVLRSRSRPHAVKSGPHSSSGVPMSGSSYSSTGGSSGGPQPVASSTRRTPESVQGLLANDVSSLSPAATQASRHGAQGLLSPLVSPLDVSAAALQLEGNEEGDDGLSAGAISARFDDRRAGDSRIGNRGQRTRGTASIALDVDEVSTAFDVSIGMAAASDVQRYLRVTPGGLSTQEGGAVKSSGPVVTTTRTGSNGASRLGVDTQVQGERGLPEVATALGNVNNKDSTPYLSSADASMGAGSSKDSGADGADVPASWSYRMPGTGKRHMSDPNEGAQAASPLPQPATAVVQEQAHSAAPVPAGSHTGRSTPSPPQSVGVGGEGHAEMGVASQFAPSTLPLRGLRVLYADDENTNRRLMERMLKRMGCSLVVCVEDGDGVVPAWKSQLEAMRASGGGMDGRPPFDVVLLDILMPKMTGDVACKILTQDMAIAAPVLACTANGANNMPFLRSCGFREVIHKPFDGPKIRAAVQKHVALVQEQNEGHDER